MRYLGFLFAILVTIGTISAVSAQTFTVCEGERSERANVDCPGPHDAFVNCTEIDNRAAQMCKQAGASGTPNIVHLPGAKSGGRCGYALHRVTCQ